MIVAPVLAAPKMLLVLGLPVSGMTSLNPHAFSRYPFHANFIMLRTNVRFFSSSGSVGVPRVESYGFCAIYRTSPRAFCLFVVAFVVVVVVVVVVVSSSASLFIGITLVRRYLSSSGSAGSDVVDDVVVVVFVSAFWALFFLPFAKRCGLSTFGFALLFRLCSGLPKSHCTNFSQSKSLKGDIW